MKIRRPGLVVLMWAAAASAAPSGADKLAAEALFDAGRKLMGDGKYAEACPKFEESNRLDPGVGVLLYLADCHEKSGKLASAWLTWREAAAAARGVGQLDREKLSLQRAAALEPKLAKLQIDVPADHAVAGMVVLRDGTEVNKAIWGVPVPVDPGDHTVEVKAPGRKTWSKTINVGNQPALLAVAIPKLEIEAAPAASTAPPAASTAPPPAASAPPPAASSAPALKPPAEEGGNKTAEIKPRALVLGARLGGLIPVGNSGATASGQSASLSSLYGPGAALEVDAGLKFSPNLSGYVWFNHAFLSGGSNLDSGGARSKGADRQALGVALQVATSDDKKIGFFGEAGVLLYHRFQLREEATGPAGSCNSTTTLAGNAARLGGGVHVPLGDSVRLSPFVTAEVGRFVQASYDGTGACALRSGKYEISQREVHASLLAGASLSYGFGL